MKNNWSFNLKIMGMNPPLCGIAKSADRWIQLTDSNASQMTFRLLRFRNWSFTIIALLVLIAFGLGISDCAIAASGLYSVNLRYDAAKAIIPADLKADEKTRNAIINVAEFTDTRQVDDKKIIGRVTERDGTKIPVFPKYVIPTKAVANGVKEYLKKAGYKVADKLMQWDLKEETIPKGAGKVMIGGNIEELEVTCERGVFSHAYKVNVKLTIIFADSVKGKVLYKSKVESSLSRDDISFSEEWLGDQASTALGDAIEKVFQEKAVEQKIKEAITQ